MARIDSKLLFLTTSPRTPEKMIPEIELLIKYYNNKIWDTETQCDFMNTLSKEHYFNGKGEKDPAFSARDRINRAPKSLGFVTLSPTISLTPAGNALLNSKRKEEVFLRQMLKFQLPSPYHKPTEKAAKFCIKPYLEMLRLVRTMGTLKFDELQIFGMQLTNWHNFDNIIKKIEIFRSEKALNKLNYRRFKTEYLHQELKAIYAERIASGKIKTRESNERSLEKFLKTQSSNLRDYADACFRYLRATGLVNVSHIGKSLSIIPERIPDVDYILNTIDRNPCFVDDEEGYIKYLGNSEYPKLLTDNRQAILERLNTEFQNVKTDTNSSTENLKELLYELIDSRKESTIKKQIKDIKDYKLYDDIQNTYKLIEKNELYDAPLMFEWNTWRAMTMIDGGNIKANLNFDDFGNPLSTAQGNMTDILCDYGDYIVSVEVTLATGQKQYDMEGEPVSRHLGKIKKDSGKPCYCLFIAPAINEACIAHFYTLHNLNITYYGGKSTIIPLPLHLFQKMLEDSYKAYYTPSPEQMRSFFDFSNELVKNCNNEFEWYEGIKKRACDWLNIHQ